MTPLSLAKRFYSALPMAVLGAAFGHLWPEFGMEMQVGSYIYGMLVITPIIPFVMFSIIAGVIRLRSIGQPARYASRFFLSYIAITLLLVVTASAVIAWMPRIYAVNDATRVEIGKLIETLGQPDIEYSSRNVSLADTPGSKEESSFSVQAIVNQIITTNIFRALVDGNAIGIIIFAILIGVSVRLLARETERFQEICFGFAEAFNLLLKWINKLLPFAVFCLLASLFARGGSSVLLATAAYVEVIFMCSLAFIFACILVVWLWSGLSIADVAACFREPLIITASCNNSYPSIPAAIRLLGEKLGIGKFETEAMLPLGMSLQSYGAALYFLCAMVFAAELLAQPYSIEGLAAMASSSISTMLNSLGSPALVTVSAIKRAGDAIPIPTEVVIILLGAIDSLSSPCRHVIRTCGNLAITILVLKPRGNAPVATRTNSEE